MQKDSLNTGEEASILSKYKLQAQKYIFVVVVWLHASDRTNQNKCFTLADCFQKGWNDETFVNCGLYRKF